MIISITIDEQEKVFPFCLAKDLPLLHHPGMKLESSPATEAAAGSRATSLLQLLPFDSGNKTPGHEDLVIKLSICNT